MRRGISPWLGPGTWILTQFNGAIRFTRIMDGNGAAVLVSEFSRLRRGCVRLDCSERLGEGRVAALQSAPQP